MFEEMREIDQCGMEKFGTLDINSSEKTIAILGDKMVATDGETIRGERLAKSFYVTYGKNVCSVSTGARGQW